MHALRIFNHIFTKTFYIGKCKKIFSKNWHFYQNIGSALIWQSLSVHTLCSSNSQSAHKSDVTPASSKGAVQRQHRASGLPLKINSLLFSILLNSLKHCSEVKSTICRKTSKILKMQHFSSFKLLLFTILLKLEATRVITWPHQKS